MTVHGMIWICLVSQFQFSDFIKQGFLGQCLNCSSYSDLVRATFRCTSNLRLPDISFLSPHSSVFDCLWMSWSVSQQVDNVPQSGSGLFPSVEPEPRTLSLSNWIPHFCTAQLTLNRVHVADMINHLSRGGRRVLRGSSTSSGIDKAGHADCR